MGRAFNPWFPDDDPANLRMPSRYAGRYPESFIVAIAFDLRSTAAGCTPLQARLNLWSRFIFRKVLCERVVAATVRPFCNTSCAPGDLLMVMTRKLKRLAICSVSGLIASMACGGAQAQWGMDYGMFGMGFGLGHQTPASVSFLNDHALARGAAAAASRPQNLRAPIPVSKDVDFFNRYDVETRIAMEEGVARRRIAHRAPTTTQSQAPPAASSPLPRPARPLVPLASFFDSARRLVWPADAPTHEEFAAKKSASDAKTLELLEELERKGYARISTAADARTMLLNYGQPALQFLRDTTTPRLSDAFHIFLMSLYDSIGQATTDPAGN